MELYKLDSKGKIRILIIEADGDILRQTSGLLSGKKVVAEKVIGETNVGKTNYQTGEETCISKAESLVTKKIREGYYKTIAEAETTILIKPMLAEKYLDFKDRIDHETSYIQPKLDGMRAICHLDGKGGVELLSRTQKPIENLDFLVNDLSNYRGMPITIDGELYAHGFDLQENMKMLKKFRPGETDVHIKYHIYDTVDEQPFWVRIKRTGFYSEYVIEVDTRRFYNENEADIHHKEFIDNGYEGSIIRYGKQAYEMKRSRNLLKRKDFDDVVGEVIDILPQEADPTKGKLKIRLSEGENTGVEFLCSYNGTHDKQRDLLENKQDYIGETAEIRYFGYTQDGVPNIAKVHAFRLDK